jgi:hypothetical protein
MQAMDIERSSAGALATPLRVPVRVSVRQVALLSLLHALTLAIVPLLVAPWFINGCVAALVCVHALISIGARTREHGGLSCVLLDAQGQWRIVLDDGGMEAARVLTPCLALPWLVVLRFSTESGRRPVAILTAGDTPAAALRRLCVRLRTGVFGSRCIMASGKLV